MARIFLSHSSADNAEAVALRDWLLREGWDDLFLDLDPTRGLAAGERWERALNEAASRCEAVLFLVSKNWLASRWCLKEFNLAHRLGKRLFGVLSNLSGEPETTQQKSKVILVVPGVVQYFDRFVVTEFFEESMHALQANYAPKIKCRLFVSRN